MTDLEASPWLLGLFIGALLMIYFSSHLVSRLLLRRLLLIPLAWLIIHYLSASFPTEFGFETAALAMGGAALFIIPLF